MITKPHGAQYIAIQNTLATVAATRDGARFLLIKQLNELQHTPEYKAVYTQQEEVTK